MSDVSVLILAAGKGVRMRSTLPKVLHPVGGVPMIERVLLSVSKLKPKSVAVIVGHQSEVVKSYVSSRFPSTQFFIQPVLNGSGGAVRQAISWLKRQKGDVIITCGDTPLLTVPTLKKLTQTHRKEKNSGTVLTTIMQNPFGYGRIVRDFDDSVEKIVEQLDATEEERKIQEINTGSYCFSAPLLVKALTQLKANNAKGEYYLTDVLEILRKGKNRIGASITNDSDESMGINQRRELAKAEAVLRQRKCDELMAAGVTIIDPASTYVDDEVQVGMDTIIWPQTVLRGKTVIGKNCEIGPWTHIKNTKIKDQVSIKASFVEDSLIENEAKIGPFSRVRPNSHIGAHAHLGNFSEVKNTQVGEGSKVNHLSYLGDAKIGKNVNIGAGSITCNYDGIKKSPTQIQDYAFIGSNVNLIAPIKVGQHAVVGAGSSLSQDVPAWSLVYERADRKVREGWAKNKFGKVKKS